MRNVYAMIMNLTGPKNIGNFVLFYNTKKEIKLASKFSEFSQNFTK